MERDAGGLTFASGAGRDDVKSTATLWPRLAELPLFVGSCRYERLEPGPGFGEARANRLVCLAGEGGEGLGEDITLFIAEAPELALAGTWTLGGFCEHLAGLEQWAEPPEWNLAPGFRTWAYESAALDLALTQAGLALHEVLGREPRPVSFVNSLGLGYPPSPVTILRRLERYPDLRFKLDAKVGWTPSVVAALAETGAVHTIDFKGQYGFDVEDVAALVGLYEMALDAFGEAVLEDPHDLPEIGPLIGPHAARVAYDAPITTVADLDATPLQARTFNIKPSRIGSLRELFALYAACQERGLAMYGGGMGELGVARGQIQLLASLFHPGAPNDIAPPGYNAVDPAAGLPTSPLDPSPAAAGFRRVASG